MKQNHLLSVRNVTVMAMFGALAAVLMIFEVPLPFIAPSFYGMDISEVPVLVGTFALGPVAGVVMELVKILVKLILKPTSTGFVGEFANFCFGCSLVLPAGNGCGNCNHDNCGCDTQCGCYASVLFPFHAPGHHHCCRRGHQPGYQQCVDIRNPGCRPL